jgi:hypothetical protein
MDDKAPLIITLSALRKTYQVHESEQSFVSSETARQLNYVFNAINEIVPGAYLPTTYISHTKPSEVLAQIELAFDQLGQGSMSVTKSGQDEPLPVRSASQPAQQAKPKIFIGCSTQGLTEAEIIQTLLVQSDKVYPVIWNQGVFGLMFGTLETLVAKVPEYDYAVLVLTPDDVVVKKEHEVNAARDNVLFELLLVEAFHQEGVLTNCGK